MRVAVCFFTGTGNTETAARELADRFGPDNTVELHNIELLPSPLDPGFFAPYDMVGFAAPVYAYNEPPAFARFLRDLPPGDGRPAFLFMTAGQDPEAGLAHASRALRRRGFDLRAAACLFMPGNVGCYHDEDGEMVFRFWSPTRRFEVAGMEKKRGERIDRLVSSLLAGKTMHDPSTAWQRLASWFLRPIFFGLAAPLMRFLLRAGPACNSCGICARTCPSRCIEVDDRRAQFGSGCTACVRCLNVCPRHAIHARWPLSLLNRTTQYLAPGWSPPQHD